jgi:hypothetical protein
MLIVFYKYTREVNVDKSFYQHLLHYLLSIIHNLIVNKLV